VFILEIDENNVSINSEVRTSLNTELLLSDINSLSTYTFYVEAYNEDSSLVAKSNTLEVNVGVPNKPLFNYLEYATINHDNGMVEISCLVDNEAIIDYYEVFRSLRKNNSFNKIDEIPFSGVSTLHYTDNTVETLKEFYQYKILPVDTCGVRLFPPPVNEVEYINDTSFAQTILLQGEINLDYSNDPSLVGEYTNTVFFNEYDKWLGEVSEYKLYRSINREPFNLLPIYTWDRVNNPNEELKYIDVVTEFGDGNGRFCYYIEALEGNNTPYSAVPEGSLSNISCLSQTPIIFVPSVFTPNGDEHNEVFHPVTYYVSDIGYSFTIYSRIGEIIFSTNDPSKGWDGTFNGNVVQDGNYVYHLQYLNGVGNLTEKTDVISLVR